MNPSLEQTLRNLFWNPAEVASLPTFALSLVLSALLGALLSVAYVRFGRALSNRRLFARNFLLLTVTTTLIISIVKSSLALSLGLVGALSIVRFRAAIKEPEELAWLFLAIGVGLGLGAGQPLITLTALVIILGLVAFRHLFDRQPDQPNLFLTITSPAPNKLTASQMLEALQQTGARASLRRFDETPEAVEAAFLVDFAQVGQLETFNRRLRELNEAARVSCVDDRGLAA
jgi:uncharacterized membrane protein YhiD involved in acid resistance